MAETTNQTPHTRTASYLADPSEVGRVLLLYSGGLDTSVMLKWIAVEYAAEVVTLTVNLGRPGEDYEVIEGKARRIGALICSPRYADVLPRATTDRRSPAAPSRARRPWQCSTSSRTPRCLSACERSARASRRAWRGCPA